MNRSYWDCESIIADAVRLPCHVSRDLPGLAHLQGNVATSSAMSLKPIDSISDGTLRKNTRIDIPFWLAELLALHGVVDLTVPKSYAQRVRNALDAEPKSVQLRNLNAWWYAIGVRLCTLMEAGELIEVLQKTYGSRIAQIFSSGQHLATSSSMRSASTGQDHGEMVTQMNDNMDSLGGYSSISMSAEMMDFINGLDESEMQLLRVVQESVTRTHSYLADN